MSSAEVLETPVKSENDKKSYRLIRLENGVKALLISTSSEQTSSTQRPAIEGGDKVEDDDTNLAACAVCFDVGSFSDPSDVQGLAHFLEHLIFLGSEKYPLENGFNEFVDEWGAYTGYERTRYFFRVREQHLNEGLDRLSNLIEAPLLLKNSMTRERKAVDSEYSAQLNDETVRRHQILASLSPESHPFRSFNCGNLKTLKENIDDDVLHRRIKDFKTRHYSAHRMGVCVQSKQSLDSLQEMVVQHFSGMPNNHLPGDDFTAFNQENSFQSKFHEKVYFVKPSQGLLRIDITWCMEPRTTNFKFKPDEYVSNILKRDGKGSLLSYLRKKSWAVELNANTIDISSSAMFSLFCLNIELTEDGFNHLDGVLEAVYSYLKLLQVSGPSETLFHAQQNITANRFRFAEEVEAFENVQKLVEDLEQYPAKDTLTGPKLLFEYNSDVIRKFIDELNSRKFNIMITSNRPYNGQVTFESIEPWYGTKYTELDMPATWIELWQNAKPLPEFALPEPNPFIADDFTIFFDAAGSPVPKYPTKILDNDLGELWFRQDDKFLLPTAHYRFQFVSPHFSASTKNAALTTLLPRMLEYQFVEELYPAKIAGLSYLCTSSDLGLFFEVSGFNQKLHLIVDIFCKRLKSLANDSNENQFRTAIQQQLKENENNLLNPEYLSLHFAINANKYHQQPIYEKNRYLHSLTFVDFQEFCRKFGEEMRLKALIQGNVGESQALNVMNGMLNELKFKKIQDPTSIQLKAPKFPIGWNYLRCKNFNAQDVNSAISNVYQIGPYSYETGTLLSLLEMVAEEQCFYNLRTVEQLAYTVFFGKYNIHNMLGYNIYVGSQETKFTADYVDERIENFRRILLTIIENMSDDEFNATKAAFAGNKLSEFNDLNEEAQHNWKEIEANQYEFDRRSKEVACLPTITKSQLLDFYRASYGQNEQKLSIQVIGNANGDQKQSKEANQTDAQIQQNSNGFDGLSYVGFKGEAKGHLIEDFVTFKNSLDVYSGEEASGIVSKGISHLSPQTNGYNLLCSLVFIIISAALYII